jgi:phosphoglycerol transferase MdoB-like AlkP superfamily enzyme
MNLSKSSDFTQEYKPILKLVLSVLSLNFAIYTVIRTTFYFWNSARLENIPFGELGLVFLQGARFDLAIVFPIVLLCFLLLIFRPVWLSKALMSSFVVFHAIILCGNFVDSELVNFVGRRFTKNTLYLIGEGNITNLMTYFWMTVVTAVSLGFYLYLNFKISQSFYKKSLSIKSKVLGFFCVVILTVIFGRGGFQEKPISFVDAKVIDHPFAHHMVLNTTFSAIKSFGQPTLEKMNYFDQNKIYAELNLNPALWRQTEIPKLKGKNLIIFILESFSSEYITPENTPFFLKLAEKGSYFSKSYANGRRSIEGIASIMAGVPALMEEPFVNSEFATNDFVGLGNLFKKNGYHTSFFHGAKNGSMRFDLFTKAAGFDHYYGLNEFPDKTKNDGAWGIWDEDFLKWTCSQLGTFSAPFAATVFTLTSHQPYNIPENLKQKFSAGTHPVIQAIKYTDFALEQFFECAKNQKWFADSAFLFVADHTGPSLKTDPTFKSLYEVPILFYAPDTNLNLSTDQYAQHIDVLPTLNDLFDLGLKNENHLSRSLYKVGQKTIALYSDHNFELVGDTSLSDDKLKAIRQYYSQGLYDNRLYAPAMKGN